MRKRLKAESRWDWMKFSPIMDDLELDDADDSEDDKVDALPQKLTERAALR
jgi:hypothetical protein